MFTFGHRRPPGARTALVAVLAAGALGAAACGDTGGDSGGGGGGQSDFKRPVNMIVPFTPGSGSDRAARLLSPVLEQALDVQFPIINVPGATGNTGMTKLLQSRPSENVAVTAADTLATVAAGSSSFQLDEVKPVCRVSLAPSYLWVNTKGDYKSWDDLMRAAKARPGKITVATVGQGGIDDIMLGALAQKGIKFRAVPFAENAERRGALLSNDVDALYEQAGDVQENIAAKQFTPVLMFGSERSDFKGDYELSSKLGVTDVIDQWRALFANADMPDGQVQALSEACGNAEKDKGFTSFQQKAWERPNPFLPQSEFEPFVRKELQRMQTLGRQYGVYKEDS
ncbi:MAG TPA: tripartite tricarboxylate transporter substrate binding protein [Solirubrobacteraceae bacterium]|nr:tripartite tricarboxylate transporter substrate binding protein [Solirubrobacteraceae bacterium]